MHAKHNTKTSANSNKNSKIFKILSVCVHINKIYLLQKFKDNNIISYFVILRASCKTMLLRKMHLKFRMHVFCTLQ